MVHLLFDKPSFGVVPPPHIRQRRPGPRYGPVPIVEQGVWRDRGPSLDFHLRHGQERLREA
jgi:hypothetical protein